MQSSPTYDVSNFFLTFGEFLANFEKLVLGCIETNLCIQILVGISYLFEKKIEKRDMGKD